MKLKLITLVFLFTYSVMMSQTKTSFTYKNTSVKEVILDLENKFNIKLSFDSELIDSQFVNYISDGSTLEEVLIVIESQTNLQFQKVSDRYYTITGEPDYNFQKPQGLDEVFITEYLTTGIKKRKDGSIVITPKSLGILPGLTEPDVLQSLQLLPGIKSPNETATELYVRGGTPDQNLVLWDDIKIYNSGHFFGSISAFNPYIIKDVKLFTSGTTAKYGNRISSVIDISSQNDIPNKTKGGFGFNMTHADVYVKTPISKKLGLMVSTRRSYTDLINTFTFQNLSKRVFQNTKISEGNTFFDSDPIKITKEFFRFSDVTAKVIYEPTEQDKVVFSSLFTTNKLDYNFFNEAFGDISKDKLDVENQGMSIKWMHSYNPNFSQALKAYKSYHDLKYKGSNIFSEGFSDYYQKENNIDDYGIALHNIWRLNDKKTVNFGYDFSSSKVYYAFKYNTDAYDLGDLEDRYNFSNTSVNNIHALYLEYNYRNDDKWLFNIGLRANQVSLLDEFYVEPRFNFEAKLNTNFKLKLSAEQLHQTIVQIEELVVSNFGLESELWILAEDNISPLLKSEQASVGVNFNKEGWNLDVDFYVKKIKGLTSFSRGFNVLPFSTGESDIKGVDILLKKKIDNYRTWFGYSFVNNNFKFKNLNNNEPFPANFHITNQINWSHSYIWNNLSFSLGWNYRTGAPYTRGLGLDEDDNVTIIYDKINNERLPSYHRLDFSTTYKFNFSPKEKWKGKIGLSIFNIYNKKNILSKTYEVGFTSSGNNVLRELEKTSLGITPNLIFRVEF